MDDGSIDLKRAARDAAYAMPLSQINPADAEIFRTNTWGPYFERLRSEDPVHWAVSEEPDVGGYWSLTKFNDIMAVDSDHERFSSEPAIVLPDPAEDFTLPMFIAMDPPKHDVQRKTVSPIVAPHNLAYLEPIIRERAAKILDDCPIGVPFDWVDKVSIELTTMTLATLFDFPWEDRRKLTRWSDIATAGPESGIFPTKDPEEFEQLRRAELFQCVDYFMRLWNERVNAPPAGDLISLLAHGESTRNMDRMEYLGNLILLIVGGNDTTRNSMSGGLLALHQNPAEYAKLQANPNLVDSAVSEIIRWQTPVIHMRRTTSQDTELGGKQIKAGEKVVMWYISGNRDPEAIENPDSFIIDRARPRQHLSFGFGIHRCVGNRLAELQLKILWQEILTRFPTIEVVGDAQRVYSNFIRGIRAMPVRIPG